jgi:hypothetical protein
MGVLLRAGMIAAVGARGFHRSSRHGGVRGRGILPWAWIAMPRCAGLARQSRRRQGLGAGSADRPRRPPGPAEGWPKGMP